MLTCLLVVPCLLLPFQGMFIYPLILPLIFNGGSATDPKCTFMGITHEMASYSVQTRNMSKRVVFICLPLIKF